MKKRSRVAKGSAAKGPAPGDVDPRFAPVVAAFAGDRRVTTGMMMASLGLKVSGRIFAMMVRGRFVAKLPRARVDELVRLGHGERFDPRRDGRVMKEWFVAADEAPAWIELAREAHRYVRAAKG